MERHPLLDEIVLIDSRSTDRTREIAQELGIPVYVHQDILPEQGALHGKGEALWKSLHVLKGDIVAWIDTDIRNSAPALRLRADRPVPERPAGPVRQGVLQAADPRAGRRAPVDRRRARYRIDGTAHDESVLSQSCPD